MSLSEDKKTITYTVTGNTSSEPRTAYFKLEFIFWETDGLSYVYSDMITVTQNPSDKPVAITSPENIFLESNAEGIEAARDNLDFELFLQDNIGGSESRLYDTVRSMADKGCRAIVLSSGNFESMMEKYSAEFSRTLEYRSTPPSTAYRRSNLRNPNATILSSWTS